MKIFILVALSLLLSKGKEYDFGEKKSGTDWSIINDSVMGGVSTGVGELTSNTLRFMGKLSLENNGGFVSVRSPLGEYDLSDYEKVTIRYRGNGGTFGLMFENSRRFYKPYYKAEFTPAEEWQTSTFTLNEIKEFRLGEKTGNTFSPSLQSEIIRIGFIKLDKRPGAYELEVDYIDFE